MGDKGGKKNRAKIMAKIEVENVYKIFGDNPEKALARGKQSQTYPCLRPFRG